MRIGHGYDVHKLVKERDLVLGGVWIPSEVGLLGHSDADVLLHAICDALLGAAALGDIGRHFPPSDEKYKNIDSRILLRQVGQLLKKKGYFIHNIDATVIAESPRLAPFVDQMRNNIAEDLGISIQSVNVKATTQEGLGFIGTKQGMAAHAVCLIE